MHLPRQRSRCSHLRSRYLAARFSTVASGSAITTYPRATSTFEAYATIATSAVTVTPALRIRRNSSQPTPKNRGSYARYTISARIQTTGSDMLATTYGSALSGDSENLRKKASIPPVRALRKSRMRADLAYQAVQSDGRSGRPATTGSASGRTLLTTVIRTPCNRAQPVRRLGRGHYLLLT